MRGCAVSRLRSLAALRSAFPNRETAQPRNRETS